ncbi:MAG: TatA/E family twin arginine-targeting protein translocase [Armatimonadota bacterium]
MMGSIGFPEIAVILLIALLVFGPKKLPEIGRTLGKTISELRRASREFSSSIQTMDIDDEKESVCRKDDDSK